MAEEPRRVVESGYDAIAERYAEALRGGRGPQTNFRRFLDHVLELIPERGTVLDLGCGAGLITAELAERASVVAVDLSFAQLGLARRNAPAARFLRADMAEVAFAQNSFDAVLAFWSLIHVRRDLHAGLLRRVHEWLRPSGLFAGTSGAATTRRIGSETSTGRRCTGATSTPTRIGSCSGTPDSDWCRPTRSRTRVRLRSG